MINWLISDAWQHPFSPRQSDVSIEKEKQAGYSPGPLPLPLIPTPPTPPVTSDHCQQSAAQTASTRAAEGCEGEPPRRVPPVLSNASRRLGTGAVTSLLERGKKKKSWEAEEEEARRNEVACLRNGGRKKRQSAAADSIGRRQGRAAAT